MLASGARDSDVNWFDTRMGCEVAATAFNAVSSRSHAIFTLTMESKPGAKAVNQNVTLSKFHLVGVFIPLFIISCDILF